MSVELQKQRGELFREALLKGWTHSSDVQEPWTRLLESARIERWYRKLYKAAEEPTPVGQRLVNHFMLGADPEFVFRNGTQRCDARTLGLKAGPAFGADNNGRLCELRPAPSRSALSVLASLWLAMRWMAVYHPDVLNLSWRAGSFYEGDGLGGHVHFGRKNLRLREREVAVLDRITHLQFTAGIFDREEGRLRVRRAQGAPQGQPYGALGDMRLQPHGYEYRTLPSWIDNAWLAYFNLVVSKLAVAFPDLLAPLAETDAGLTAEQARSQLRFILAYYSPLDDDARLAHAILARRGLPTHGNGLDFKSAWGLFVQGPLGASQECHAPDVWPESVPSTAEDEQELALSMFENRAPELTTLKPSWQPHVLPENYAHMIRETDTKVAPGLGEFVMRLAVYKKDPLQFFNCGHKSVAFIFHPWVRKDARWTETHRRLGLPVGFTAESVNQIWINASKDYTLEQLLKAREVLVESGIFAIWDIEKVRTGDYEKWCQSQNQPTRQKARTLFEGQKDPSDFEESPF